MHEEQASRSGVTLGLAVEPEEIVVQADERKVRQVVFNLLSNAVKFTPPGGRVDVSAQMTDGVVEVAVADTGSGIAAGGPGADLRGVPAGPRRTRQRARGHRARAAARAEVRRAARRAALGRERSGRGQHVPLHAARQAAGA